MNLKAINFRFPKDSVVSMLLTVVFACSLAAMFSRRKIAFHPLVVSSLCLAACFANAQEVKENPSTDPETEAVNESEKAPEIAIPATPVVWGGIMQTVLADPMARLPFGESETLRAPIAVHFPAQKSSICWDAKACRMLYTWKGEFLAQDTTTQIAMPAGEIAYLAAGPGPFSAAVGAYGKPKYFGFKLIEGVPEFYYSVGRVAVRERFSFSDDAETLMQHFAIDNSAGDVVMTIPEAWKDRVSTEKGTLKNRILTVSKNDAADFTLNYSLIPDETPAE